MAFFRKLSTGVGTAETKVGGYTVPADTVAVAIGLQLTNITADGTPTAISVWAYVKNGGSVVYRFATGRPLPIGAGIGVIDGKYVLEEGDEVFVKSSVAASIDAALSLMTKAQA